MAEMSLPRTMVVINGLIIAKIVLIHDKQAKQTEKPNVRDPSVP